MYDHASPRTSGSASDARCPGVVFAAFGVGSASGNDFLGALLASGVGFAGGTDFFGDVVFLNC